MTSAVRGPDRDWRWWLIPAVVLLNGTASGLLGKRASVYALAYGAFFLGAFLLWFGVTREGLRRRTIPGPAVG